MGGWLCFSLVRTFSTLSSFDKDSPILRPFPLEQTPIFIGSVTVHRYQDERTVRGDFVVLATLILFVGHYTDLTVSRFFKICRQSNNLYNACLRRRMLQLLFPSVSILFRHALLRPPQLEHSPPVAVKSKCNALAPYRFTSPH